MTPSTGVRVVELAQWVFVPVAGALLADWGADVVRVDRPEGDPYRGLATQGIGTDSGGVNLSMALANRGKRSIALDLRTDGGQRGAAPAARHAPTCCSPASGPAPSTASGSAPTRSARATRGSSTPGATATACAVPTPACPATTPRPSGPGAASATCSRRPSATTRSRQRGAFGDRNGGMALAFGIAAALLRAGADRRGLGRRRLAAGHRDVDAVVRRARRPCRATTPRAPEGRVVVNPLVAHLPDQGRAPHPARVPRVRPLLGGRSASSSVGPTWPTIRASPTYHARGAQRRGVRRGARRGVRRPDVRRVEGAARRRSTRRGRRCRRSRSCSTTRRCSPTTTSARSRSTTAPRYRLPRVPVQFDERPPDLRRAPEHGEHTEAVLLELGYTWDDIAALGEAGGDPVTDDGRCPVPDEQSAPFWAAAAGGVLVARPLLALRARSPTRPTSCARTAARTDPAFAFEPVERAGHGPLVDGRPPVVPPRLRRRPARSCSSTSPSTSSDDLRLIGRLLDGPDAPLARRRPRSTVAFERPRPTASPSPPSRWTGAVTGRFAGPQPGRRRRLRPEPDRASTFDRPLGRGRRRHRPRRRSPTPGCESQQVDGFVASSLLPTAGDHAARRRRQHACRPTGWPQHLGVEPALRHRLPGLRPAPRVRWRWRSTPSPAAPPTTSLVHRALHNPPGRYHGNSHARGAGADAVDRCRRASSGRSPMIGMADQRVPPALRRDPRGARRGRGRGPQERRPDPVVVLARPAARPSTSTWPRR